MTQPTTCNPARAQPMRTLSKRDQAQLQPRRYGPGSWDLTPWVWVVEFKRLEATHG